MGELGRWEVEEGLKFWLQKKADESVCSHVIEDLIDEVTDSTNLGELPWETIKREKGIVK